MNKTEFIKLYFPLCKRVYLKEDFANDINSVIKDELIAYENFRQIQGKDTFSCSEQAIDAYLNHKH